jgi:methionyl-tRNA formyltransferase
MEYKMDAGPILAEEKVAILPTETTEELRVRLIEIGGNLLVKILPLFLAEDRLPQKPQDESQATFCKKIKKEDGLVNPLTDDPQTLYNKFRAYHKWPRIYYFDTPKQGEGGIDTKGKRVIITNAELKDGKFIIKKVIPEGGKERTL